MCCERQLVLIRKQDSLKISIQPTLKVVMSCIMIVPFPEQKFGLRFGSTSFPMRRKSQPRLSSCPARSSMSTDVDVQILLPDPASEDFEETVQADVPVWINSQTEVSSCHS